MSDLDDDPCSEPMRPAWPGLLAFDYAAAEREGWTIAQTDPYPDGSPCVGFVLLDMPEARQAGLRTVHDVRAHVLAQAKAGSALHQQAIALLDPKERFVILAGYGKGALSF